MIFSEPAREPANDLRLAEAMCNAGTVLLLLLLFLLLLLLLLLLGRRILILLGRRRSLLLIGARSRLAVLELPVLGTIAISRILLVHRMVRSLLMVLLLRGRGGTRNCFRRIIDV